MKSQFCNAIVLVTMLLISSFKENKIIDFIGTYGTSSSDSSSVKLTINPDHTFFYQDFFVQKTIIKGSWRLKGNKVVLNSNNPETKFPKVWSFDKNGQVAQSRKGISFYRLCKIMD